jgi:hypothetical protein
MKIFIQMSVAGFKVFDVGEFRHECEKGRYALIEEIGATQDGTENFRTHIIRNDIHGLRLETLRMFSSNDIIMLLHDDTFEGKPSRCLYADKFALTKDKFNRDCDMSLCIMSENEEEVKIVNKFGHYLIVEEQQALMEKMKFLLRRETIDDKLVLLFDFPLWHTLCEIVLGGEPVTMTTSINFNGIARGSTQVVVLGHGQDKGRVIYNMKGLFNQNLYLTLTPNFVPLYRNTLAAPDTLSPMTSYSSTVKKDDSKHNPLDIGDIFNEIHQLINKLKKQKL